MTSKVNHLFLKRFKQVHDIDVDLNELTKFKNIEFILLKTLQEMRDSFYKINASNLYHYSKNKDLVFFYIDTFNFIDANKK